MSIIVAFFCGMCFFTLADSIADYISAQASLLESKAEALSIRNILRKRRLAREDKNENIKGE